MMVKFIVFLDTAPSALIIGCNNHGAGLVHVTGLPTSSFATIKNMRSMLKYPRTVLDRFADKTSMHGVGYIQKSKHWLSKVFWACLFVIALGSLTAHLNYLIYNYVQWPKITTVTLGFSNLNLPAVTICNVNRIKKSKIDQLPEPFRSFLAEVDPSLTRHLNSSSGKTKAPGKQRKRRFVGQLDDINFTKYDSIRAESQPNFRNKDAISQVEETFTNMYMNMKRIKRYQIGHKMKSMLVSCSFNGIGCDETKFSVLMTSKYGVCYTINTTGMTAYNSGPESGLSLILFTNNEQYLPGITQGYGVRLDIHAPDQIPLPSENGVFISAASQTDIGLRLVKISRLNGSYGDCNNGVEFEREYRKRYSRQACLIICQQMIIFRKCGCFKKRYEEFFLHQNDSMLPCKSRQEHACMEATQDRVDQKQYDLSSCNCINPCTENQYIKSFSFRQWPTEDYSIFLKQSICEMDSVRTCNHLESLDIYSLGYNFIKLNIYYEDLNYEFIEEKPEIEAPAFVSDIGGALGLWLGLSFISVFEVFQLVMELCRGIHCSSKISKIGHKSKKQKKDSQEDDIL